MQLKDNKIKSAKQFCITKKEKVTKLAKTQHLLNHTHTRTGT